MFFTCTKFSVIIKLLVSVHDTGKFLILSSRAFFCFTFNSKLPNHVLLGIVITVYNKLQTNMEPIKEEAAEEVECKNQSSVQVFIKQESEDEQDSKYHSEDQGSSR
jgi:hypothetical protein